jgi:hypothetical protein
LQAKSWGALPESGGLRNQRPGELERMSWAYTVHMAITGYRRASGMARLSWIDSHPDLYDLYGDVITASYKRNEQHNAAGGE